MSDFLVWRDEWLLTVEPFDTDHKEMLRLLNELTTSQADAEAAGLPPLLDRLDQLIVHLRDHFRREESFLSTIGFSGLDEHRREHVLQLAEFTHLRRTLDSSGAKALDADAITSLKHFFFNHVVGEDRRYAEFYLSQPSVEQQRSSNLLAAQGYR